jgi:alpha-glucosidase
MALLLAVLPAKARNYELSSPDGNLKMKVSVGEELIWSLSGYGEELISPSPAALVLSDGKVLGSSMKVRKAERRSVERTEEAPFFKRSSVREHFNELKLVSRDFDVVFRAYDDGVAYRFVTHRAVTVRSETAQFRFPADWTAWVPYVRKPGTFEEQFFNSFENLYEHIPLSAWTDAAKTDGGVSYNGFTDTERKRSATIDYIFYKGADALQYRTLNQKLYGVDFISDHWPIVCTFNE